MIFFITLIISFLFLEPNFSLEIQNKNIWRYHFNLEDIKESILYDSKIYCFAERGYFYLDLESNNIIKNTVDLNLSGVDVIKALDYNGELVLIYSSGKIDFVKGNRVSSVDLAITENVKINHVTNKEKYIYVSSTEGVYVIDAENKTVKERYEYFYDPNDKVNVSFINFSKNKIYAISNGDIFFRISIQTTKILETGIRCHYLMILFMDLLLRMISCTFITIILFFLKLELVLEQMLMVKLL